MTLNPRFNGQRLYPRDLAAVKGFDLAGHTIDIYLDYACPFSKKLFDTVYDGLIPKLANTTLGSLQIIFRQQIQPWHPASTLMHEAAAAILQLAPSQFGAYSKLLFAHQREYYDESVAAETRNQTYRRLVDLAGSLDGVKPDELLKLLEVPEKPGPDGPRNVGNRVTNDLKVLVKTNRLVGVHVTPTVLLNGVVVAKIDSSFTTEQFLDWLAEIETSG